MDKFREEYRHAAGELPQPHLDAAKVQDELHHYKMQRQGSKSLITRGCTAAAVFLLCGAGTVAAKNIRESIIRVNDNGFTISSHTEKELEDFQKGILDPASVLKIGGVSSIEDDVPEVALADAYEPEIEEYDSLKAFREEGNVAVPEFDLSLLGQEFTGERVDVVDGGTDVTISLSNENTVFFMHQMDHRGYESYSSGISYMGTSSNERKLTNESGLAYVMFDSVNEKGETESVHAAISLEGRDLTITFQGFDEEVIEAFLYALDLTVYFQED